MPERLRPFGTSLVRQCPQGLFRPDLKSTHSPLGLRGCKLPYFTLVEHLIEKLIFPYMKAGMRKDLVKMMALVFVCRVGRKAGKRAVESVVKELLIFCLISIPLLSPSLVMTSIRCYS